MKKNEGWDHSSYWEKLLWSIALPGFGQILNNKLLKGVLLILLEFLINIQSNLNKVIIYSFNRDIESAIRQTNYKWLMFYPCIYLFAIWDAYRDAGGGKTLFSFLPFVFSAYIGTIGVIYSPTGKIFGILLGPVFLPIMCLLLGAGIGYLFQVTILWFINKTSRVKKSPC